MNKILRKSREFGLMIRLPEMSSADSLDCVKKLRKGNIPLIVINCNNNNWESQLREIAFKEDLFIAAENIRSLEQAYTAAGNGAQFFFLNEFNSDLMMQLQNSGLFFVPAVTSDKEKEQAFNFGAEAIFVNSDDYRDEYHINQCLPFKINQNSKTLFTIIDVDKNISDYEAWINDVVKKYLGISFTSIIQSDEKSNDFAALFSAINKCKLESGNKDVMIMECADIDRTISYLKWKEIYVNPNSAIINDGRIISGFLDKELNGFKILLKERENEY